MLSYCSEDLDFIIAPGELTSEVLERGKMLFGNFAEWKMSVLKPQDKVNVISMECYCKNFTDTSISKMVQRNGGIPVYPIRYENGWEYYKVNCFNEEKLATLILALEKLSSKEVLSIKYIEDNGINNQMNILSEIFNELTENQVNLLIKAFEAGYYNIPRRSRSQDLAEELNITRYGVEKSIRSAEYKLLRSIMPFLYMIKENTLQVEQIDNNSF